MSQSAGHTHLSALSKTGNPQIDVSRAIERLDAVEHQIEARGVRNPLVLAAMRSVPREAFLPERLRKYAYEDAALRIAAGQSISQPYIVAVMTDALGLKGGETVLEIGTGSGYAAAVLANIAGHVHTVERIARLASQARAALQALNYGNIDVVTADGSIGLPEFAPYDAIIVAAAAPTVPESLQAQLRIGARLVIPVGQQDSHQELVRITRAGESKFNRERIADVCFVPLIGNEGGTPVVPVENGVSRLRPEQRSV